MSIYFEIQADQPARAINFYQQVFGWSFTEVKGLPVSYWTIQTETDPGGGLLQRPANAPPPGCGTNAFVCSFQIDNFDSTQSKITRLGGMVALAKFKVPGKCWQGYFVDTEGNTFGIFEVI
jgi:predicted enzyme related to lactoylglutathione lyase